MSPCRTCGCRKSPPDTAFIDLEAGVPYPIRIDFVDDIAWGGDHLHRVPPEGDKELRVPAECLVQSTAAVPRR